MKKTLAIILSLAVLFGLCSCSLEQPQTVNLTAMNTLMQIRVFSSLIGKNEAVELIENEIINIEKLFDANSEGSDVYKINNCKDSCQIAEDTEKILMKAAYAGEKTEGAFDITVMPVLRLWGFDNGNYGVPNDKTLKTALSKVCYKNITLSGNSLQKKAGTEISLGGIAKGYLGDKILQLAQENGINGIISLGGNIVLCGENKENGYWSVGVKNPLEENDIVCSFQSGGNLSVVTSGGYEKYFEKDGESYHHIIDTKTGKPAKSDLLSVTVIGRDGTLCDAYSTAVFSMGKEKAVEFAKENNDFEFILITAQNEIIATDGVRALAVENESFVIK